MKVTLKTQIFADINFLYFRYLAVAELKVLRDI